MNQFLRQLLLASILACLTLSACGQGESNRTALTIENHAVSDMIDVNIRIVDRVENGLVYFKAGNYGDPISYIPLGSHATVDLEPAQYYVYLKCHDGSFWISNPTLQINEGEHWYVTFTYSGGQVRQE